jgi:GntR family transcriptional regulator
MEFHANKPIYLQIGDLIVEKVLSGEWREEERIPSIRETAVNLEVNPNTVMRSYLYLDEKQIIYNKRGIGYFINENALQTAHTMKREAFLRHELPHIFRTLQLLKIDIDEVKQLYNKFCTENVKIYQEK